MTSGRSINRSKRRAQAAVRESYPGASQTCVSPVAALTAPSRPARRYRTSPSSHCNGRVYGNALLETYPHSTHQTLPARRTGVGAPNLANGARCSNRSVTSRRHNNAWSRISARSTLQSWIVQAIAKRRQAPRSGIPRARASALLSAEASRDPTTSGPNSGVAGGFSLWSAVGASPVSVSTARRSGARVLVGATSQVVLPPSPGAGVRNVTPVTGALRAAATWAASHSGRPRIACSPEGNAGGERSSTFVRPNATGSKSARRRANAPPSGPAPEARTTPGITK